MHYHAPRQIVEHPALLVQAFHAQGIPIELTDDPYRGTGSVDEIEIRLDVYPKRFLVNLSLRMFGCFPARERAEKMLTQWRDAATDAMERVREIEEFLRLLRQQREKERSLEERVTEILANLGIVSVDLALERELQFVMDHYGQVAEARDLVSRIREHQEKVVRAVATQRFDDAASHCDERERLLDSLYDLCTA